MPRDLLLEIGSDEIPARYLPLAITELKDRARAALEDSRLGFDKICAYGTPRRLALFVTELNETGKDAVFKVRGPSQKVSYDPEGNPTKALLGFARSLGIDHKSVTVESTGAAQYVYGNKYEKGRPASQVLQEAFPKVIMGMDCPHPMRWGSQNWHWYRPIRWLSCLFGGEIVPLAAGGKVAGRVTFGHRTLHPGPKEIPHAKDYFRVMESVGVQVDQNRRRAKILEEARRIALKLSGEPLFDDPLVSEVVYLSENPSGFLGRYHPQYLELPKEVLVTSMRHHQRYFPVADAKGRLLAGFVGFRDGDPARGMETVKRGNEWVLRARLEDAKFFFEQDAKVKLENRVHELKGMRFLRDAGSVFDKSQRLAQLVGDVGEKMGLEAEEVRQAVLAAGLAKCDLVTSIVRELPELEGIMGGIYGRLQGLPDQIAKAIEQQYLPRGAKDPLPEAGVPSVVALADKMDTLAVSFSLGIRVSGSQDPLGLRRSASGIVSMLVGHGYDVDLEWFSKRSLELASAIVKRPDPDARDRLWEFLMGRVESALVERDYPIAVIRAVAGGKEKRVGRLPAMAEALSEISGSQALSDVLTGWRRTGVLSKDISPGGVSQGLLKEPAERDLYEILEAGRGRARALYEGGDYRGYLDFLARLRPAIDECLDRVLIMAPEADLKENRLRLLGLASDLFSDFADFSHVLSLAPRPTS